MSILLVLLISFLNSTDSRQSGLLEVLVQNITAIYDSPKKFTSTELFNATETYIYELKTLEKELKSNSSCILRIGSVLNDNSIPNHLNKVPLSKLSESYDWDEDEIDRYMIAMSQTSRIWNNIVRFLKDHNSSLVYTKLNINYVQ